MTGCTSVYPRNGSSPLRSGRCISVFAQPVVETDTQSCDHFVALGQDTVQGQVAIVTNLVNENGKDGALRTTLEPLPKNSLPIPVPHSSMAAVSNDAAIVRPDGQAVVVSGLLLSRNPYKR